tara:strand:+ start:223 stop:414 length:192 start_codon:yes stop_codon:yes gene_type:complete
MDMITNLMTNVPDILAAAGTVCVAANSITVLTPSKSDDKVLGWILSIINFLSMNFGKNRNKDT